MADETETDTTETESSTTETTGTDQTTTDKVVDQSGTDDVADRSLMNADGGETKDQETEKGEDEKSAEGPPESYTLTPPEGMAIDDALLAEVTPVFKELGLNDEQANKLMPLAGAFAERLFTQQQDAFAAQATQWAKDAKADKELGGANWPKTEALVAKALDTLAGSKSTADKPNAFRDLLDVTKLGNHPEMIRMFRKVGEMLSEASDLPRSDAGAAVRPPREEVMYPNDVRKKETT